MPFKETRNGDVLIVAIEGDGDEISHILYENTERFLASGNKKILLDFSSNAYFGEDLHALFRMKSEVEKKGGLLAVSNLNDDMQNVFSIVGAYGFFKVYADVAEALADMS